MSLWSCMPLPVVPQFSPATRQTKLGRYHHVRVYRKRLGTQLWKDLGLNKNGWSRVKASTSSRETESMTKVVDFYLLGCRRADATDADVRTVQEALWSLQYTIPGVIAAIFGSIPLCTKREGQPFDFAVFYRFSNETGFRTFVDHSQFKEIQSTSLKQICTDCSTLVIQQEVSNDLMMIFRKGEQFEGGYDHLLLTRRAEAQSIESKEFLSVLGDVAKQSETGAVCSSVGTVLEASTEDYAGMLALASHVGSIEGIEAFEQAPPLKQLWEPDGNGLMKAQLSLTIQLPDA